MLWFASVTRAINSHQLVLTALNTGCLEVTEVTHLATNHLSLEYNLIL